MKYYTFQEQFHQPILNLDKFSTIRGKAKVEPGERFALRYWTGKPYNSKMGFLGTAVCTVVLPLKIYRCCIKIEKYSPVKSPMYLAQMEGFKNSTAMFDWFAKNHGLPFTGVLTIWDRATFKPACMECGQPVKPDWPSSYCMACDKIVADSYDADGHAQSPISNLQSSATESP